MKNNKFLNLGCGSRYHKDWINMDFKSRDRNVISHDLRNGIPYPDNYFDVVYHSHLLEHFSKTDATAFINECYRVLRPGGILRIAAPDLEKIVNNYLTFLNMSLKGDVMAEANYDWTMLELLDQCVRNANGGEMGKYLNQTSIPNEEFVKGRIGSFINLFCIKGDSILIADNLFAKFRKLLSKGKNLISNKYTKLGKFRLSGEVHQWMYDRFSLARLLREAGFSSVEVKSAFDSMIGNWQEFCLDVDADGKVYKPDSLYMEAIK